MKAKFTEPQPCVKWQPLDDNMIDVSICINEKHCEEYDDNNIVSIFFEYDFNQFRISKNDINYDHLLSCPEKYIDYVPNSINPIKKMQEQIDMLLLSEAERIGGKS